MLAIIHPMRNKHSEDNDILGPVVRTWLAHNLNCTLLELPSRVIVYTTEKPQLDASVTKVVNCTKEPAPLAPYIVDYLGRPCINIYPPQTSLSRWVHGDDEDDSKPATENKDVEPTRRINQTFWAEQGIRRLLSTSKVPVPDYPPFYLSTPGAFEQDAKTFLASRLSEPRIISLDIESRGETIDCIGVRLYKGPVHVIPIYSYNNARATTLRKFAQVWKYFYKLFTSCEVIVHNANFDLPFLCHNMRLPIPRRIYDTMASSHRCFPQVEKSLAHVTALWTNFPYHKGEYVTPRSMAQEQALWRYNAKDVAVLLPIRDAQLAYASSVPGQLSSIQTVNRAHDKYQINSLFGLRFNQRTQNAELVKSEMAQAAYLRIVRKLTGEPDFNPGSSQQCCKFFYERLKYEPQAFSDTTGEPTCSRKALYKLAIKYNNPVIPFIIKYREAAKNASNLRPNLFTPRFL